MTEEDKKLISSFEGKLRHFMFLHEELRQENANLKLLLAQKDEEIKQRKEEFHTYRTPHRRGYYRDSCRDASAGIGESKDGK